MQKVQPFSLQLPPRLTVGGRSHLILVGRIVELALRDVSVEFFKTRLASSSSKLVRPSAYRPCCHPYLPLPTGRGLWLRSENVVVTLEKLWKPCHVTNCHMRQVWDSQRCRLTQFGPCGHTCRAECNATCEHPCLGVHTLQSICEGGLLVELHNKLGQSQCHGMHSAKECTRQNIESLQLPQRLLGFAP